MKVGDLLIDESEIVETFVRASGPGGQNVNKIASAVELRFDARSLRGACRIDPFDPGPFYELAVASKQRNNKQDLGFLLWY